MPALNGNRILTPPPRVRAECVVDLVSTFERPYRFRVTVGSPDRPERRIYELVALSDSDAAIEGMRRYEREMILKGTH